MKAVMGFWKKTLKRSSEDQLREVLWGGGFITEGKVCGYPWWWEVARRENVILTSKSTQS